MKTLRRNLQLFSAPLTKQRQHAACRGSLLADAACSHFEIEAFGAGIALDQQIIPPKRTGLIECMQPETPADTSADVLRIDPKIVRNGRSSIMVSR